MAYLAISDFKFGLDRRRPRVAGVPGTLWDIANAHISRGGDIERSKKWVPVYELPAGTHGLGQVRGQLYVFGSADLAALTPLGVTYQRLIGPASEAMARVLDVKNFDGKIVAIPEYATGQVCYFYDGTRVTAWDSLSDANASLNVIAEALAAKIDAIDGVTATAYGSTIRVKSTAPGTAFTISQSTANGGATADQTITLTQLQANVAAVAEVRATADITITGGSLDPQVSVVSQVTVNGVNLLTAPVNYSASNSATATAVAVAVNNGTSSHGYSAAAVSDVVTVTAAPGTGATPNGYAVAVTTGGDVTVTADAAMAGGVTEVEPVAQVYSAVVAGTYEGADTFTITVNGTACVVTGRGAGGPTSAFVYKKRVYTTANSLLRYSKLSSATDWTDASAASGASFINLASDSDGSERLVALAQYQDSVAIFGRRQIRLYNIDTDATKNAFVQSVDGTGAIAPRSVVGYGNSDTFYLDETGIRSLRARDASNAAYVNDIGSTIDPYVRAHRLGLKDNEVEAAVGVIEPVDGRYLLALGGKVFALSYFPGSKISAWSYYAPGFDFSDFVRVGNRLYARSGDTIYLYGGEDEETYPDADEQVVSVKTPFMSAQKPATQKRIVGFDIACTNVWDCYLLVDPQDESKKLHIGRVNGTTMAQADIALPGYAPIFALEMTCSAAGPATISSVMVHFEPGDAR